MFSYACSSMANTSAVRGRAARSSARQRAMSAATLGGVSLGSTAVSRLSPRSSARTRSISVKPAQGSEVTVHYEGTLIDGTVFDSSYARNEPATFPLSNVIRGWQEGVPMMKVGEVWNFAIPPGLGYGARNVGPIPANSVLLFKIELLKAPTPAQ